MNLLVSPNRCGRVLLGSLNSTAMKIPVLPLRGRCWVAAGMLLLFSAKLFTARAQLVTLEFTPPPPAPLVAPLPWHEEGFTVASLTTYLSSGPWSPANPIVSRGRGGTNDWALQFNGASDYVARAMITNDANVTFDLLSLDVSLTSASGLNLARISTSAGGIYNLPATPGQGTLHFSGTGWEDVSFVLIEFQTTYWPTYPTLPRPSWFLDNIVLRPAEVPEPAGLGLGVLVCLGAMGRNSRRRRRRLPLPV